VQPAPSAARERPDLLRKPAPRNTGCLELSLSHICISCDGANPFDAFVACGATFALFACYWAAGRPGRTVKRIGLAVGAIFLGLLIEALMAIFLAAGIDCMSGSPLPPLQTTIGAGILGALARPLLARFRGATLFNHSEG